MSDLLPLEIVRLREAVVRGPAETAAGLRAAAEALVARTSGGRRAGEDGPLPEELPPYLVKLARHAYRITAEDIARLRAAGLSDGAIFELTVAGAVGAGLARLERGLALLEESDS